MGNCKYCGKPAGFLRSKHPECEEEERKRKRLSYEGQEQISVEIVRSIKSSESFDMLEKRIEEIEQSSFLPTEERKPLLIKGWESAVEIFLEDGILDNTEEGRLLDFKKYFRLSQIDLDSKGLLTKTAKAAVLRDVLNGIVPKKMEIVGALPINFLKREQTVWVFPESKYFEDKTRRQYVGGSHGFGFRIMKGVYYRVGSFKGRAVEHTERVHIDTGWVVVTDKNVYFAGPHKSLRLPYAKIVSFEPFSDGIGIMRDASTAKPQIFVTGDGWFTYNLITNLAQI